MNEDHGNTNGHGETQFPISTRVRGDTTPMMLSVDPRPAAAHATPLSIGFVLHAIRRRWKVALPAGLILASIVATVMWLQFEPMYAAQAYLRILDVRPVVLYSLRDADHSFQQTQVQMIRNRMVLGKVVTDPIVAAIPEVRRAPDAVDYVMENLSVAPQGRSDLYTVTFRSPNPKSAELIANEVVDSFLDGFSQTTNLKTQTMLAILDEERIKRRGEIEDLRESLVQLTRQQSDDPVAVSNLADFSAPIETALGAYQKLLVDEEVQLELAKARAEALATGTDEPDVALTQASAIEEAVNQRPDILALEQKISLKRQGFEVASPAQKVKYQAEIDKLQLQIDSARNAAREQIASDYKESVLASRRQFEAQTAMDLKQRAATINHLEQKIAAESKKIEENSGQSLELYFMKNDLAKQEQVLTQIDDRMFKIRTEMLSPERPDQIIPIQRAISPAHTADPPPYGKVAALALCGFALPFALCVLWERFAQRIFESNQLHGDMRLRVVGEIATLPSRSLVPRPGSARRYERDRAIFEESVDNLRTALAVSESCKDVQVLVVASAVAGEGKTSLTSQLAVSWARCSREPVLVIDADLRAPDLHEVFGLSREPGLAEVLQRQCTPRSAIVTNWGENIHILPAGKLASSPHRLFSGRAFQFLMQRLRGEYRRIIIDVPPVLSASETLVIAKEADGVLLCALRDISRGPQVKLALERIVLAGARPVGAVLNGTPTKHYAYRYGAYV